MIVALTRGVSRLTAILTIFLVIGCSVSREQPVQPAPQAEPAKGKLVHVSYYGAGDGFKGRKTASGRPFNPEAMTAAHRTLPFGTHVKITNRENGKSVTVEITDRGPYVKGREYDISYAAARSLGIVDDGKAMLLAEVLPQ